MQFFDYSNHGGYQQGAWPVSAKSVLFPFPPIHFCAKPSID